jgi:hypothetical protein
MSLREVVAAYDRAWREHDPGERMRLLRAALTEDAELLSPQGRWAGRAAIAEWIGGFAERVPGSAVTVSTGIDEHNGVARYGWTITGPDGARVLDGTDVCDIADDGRLRRVVMFFGPVPAD